jgi:hypothetical protein
MRKADRLNESLQQISNFFFFMAGIITEPGAKRLHAREKDTM